MWAKCLHRETAWQTKFARLAYKLVDFIKLSSRKRPSFFCFSNKRQSICIIGKSAANVLFFLFYSVAVCRNFVRAYFLSICWSLWYSIYVHYPITILREIAIHCYKIVKIGLADFPMMQIEWLQAPKRDSLAPKKRLGLHKPTILKKVNPWFTL